MISTYNNSQSIIPAVLEIQSTGEAIHDLIKNRVKSVVESSQNYKEI